MENKKEVKQSSEFAKVHYPISINFEGIYLTQR